MLDRQAENSKLEHQNNISSKSPFNWRTDGFI